MVKLLIFSPYKLKELSTFYGEVLWEKPRETFA